jgi:hypothetical protein
MVAYSRRQAAPLGETGDRATPWRETKPTLQERPCGVSALAERETTKKMGGFAFFIAFLYLYHGIPKKYNKHTQVIRKV